MKEGAPKTYEEALRLLNPQHRAFVVAYAGNASEAALKAGYANGSSGARLLKNAKIKQALALRDKRDAEQEKRAGVPASLEVPEAARRALSDKLMLDDFLELTRIRREELELFLCGVITGDVQEHGMTLTGQAWSGPPKIKDRLKAAEMLAKMNHWNASDGGGEDAPEQADPYGHATMTPEELRAHARKSARALVLLDGGKEDAG